MARIAAFSRIATPDFGTDPTGSFTGKVNPHSTGISIQTTGEFGGVVGTAFHGAAKYTKGKTHDKIHFEEGKAVLATPDKHTDLTIKFTGSGTVHDGDLLGFSLHGTVTGGKFNGKKVTTGKFSAHNTLIENRYDWTIEVTVTV
jgi:hypothetical protein